LVGSKGDVSCKISMSSQQMGSREKEEKSRNHSQALLKPSDLATRPTSAFAYNMNGEAFIPQSYLGEASTVFIKNHNTRILPAKAAPLSSHTLAIKPRCSSTWNTCLRKCPPPPQVPHSQRLLPPLKAATAVLSPARG